MAFSAKKVAISAKTADFLETGFIDRNGIVISNLWKNRRAVNNERYPLLIRSELKYPDMPRRDAESAEYIMDGHSKNLHGLCATAREKIISKVFLNGIKRKVSAVLFSM